MTNKKEKGVLPRRFDKLAHKERLDQRQKGERDWNSFKQNERTRTRISRCLLRISRLVKACTCTCVGKLLTACPKESTAIAKILKQVQAKATAMVFGLKGLNSGERRKRLGLMTLEERRERGDLIEVYKILRGLTKIDPKECWEVWEARNGARLVKNLATSGRKQRDAFISYRVIQKWNLLPVELKTARSLESFKYRLDEKIMTSS